MFYIREEGEVIHNGFNFYPKESNHQGVVIQLGTRQLWLRYIKDQKKFKFYIRKTNGKFNPI